MNISIYIVVFLLFLYGNGFTQSSRNPHPNVILIYADDLGYGDLSCYGATEITTPNIDKLASGGLRFTNAHSMASTCTPSRFSILTGEYAFRNQRAHILPGNASLLIPTDRMTLGKVFQKAGYRTAVIGKWHIGLGPVEGPDWNGEVKPGPNEVGFDYSFIFPATADRVPTVYLRNHRIVAGDPKDPIEVSYDHKVGNDPTGREFPELLKMRSDFGHDATIVNGIGRIGWMSGGHKARWTDEALAHDFLSEAEMFIEANNTRPFFMYYAINQIHVPRMPDTRFKGTSKLGYRGDVIHEMDYVVGRLMKTLDYLHLTNNTIIIFSSDNGPVLNDGYADDAVALSKEHQPAGPFRGGKYGMFEGGTRLPFIIRWPEQIKPGISNALINQTDLVASFASFCKIPLGTRDAIDSENLMDVLLGRSEKGREVNVAQNNGGVLSIVQNGWKYIEPHNGPAVLENENLETGYSSSPQLYNLVQDMGESRNLASQYPEKVTELEMLLKKIKNRQTN